MKKLLYLLLLSLSPFFCKAQKPEEPKILSPNAASFAHYGNTQVNLFTGTPNISVPLYTLKEGSIEVPITLSYHPDMVKPNNHPSWVGLGWNLNCGGVITRRVNGLPDEFVYNAAGGSQNYRFDRSYREFINLHETGADLDFLPYLFSSKADLRFYDPEADEYTFNFLGYSGKFFLSASGKWSVICDQDVTVEMMERSFEGSPSEVPKRKLFQYAYFDDFFYSIVGFVLTTPDGTKYQFGDNDDSSIEFSQNFSDLLTHGYHLSRVVADAWYLKKITDVHNHTVTFNYHPGDYSICNVGFSCLAVKAPSFLYNTGEEFDIASGNYSYGFGSSGAYMDPANSTMDIQNKEGKIIFPVYLSTVTADNAKHCITFTPGYTSSLSYDLNYLGTKSRNDRIDYQFTWLNDPSNFKWLQLNSLLVNEASGYTSLFEFNYTPTNGRGITSQRLALYSLQKTNSNSMAALPPETGEVYNFEYNNLDLGSYGGLNTDYWGFCNNSWDISGGYISNLANLKQSNWTYGSYGLLNKITYPTGGYTEFVWEANDCNWIVSKDRKSITSAHDYLAKYKIGGPTFPTKYIVGGARIAEIMDKEKSGTRRMHKKYTYYDGVLNGLPEYLLKENDRWIVEGTVDATTKKVTRYGSLGRLNLSVYSYNALTNYSDNGQSHIGYSEVKETDVLNDCETKYSFTNFSSADQNSVSHFDDDPLDVYGWKIDEDQYMDKTEIKVELGKVLNESHFASGALTKEINYVYEDNTSRYLSGFEHIKKNSIYKFEVKDMPVGVDVHGDVIYDDVPISLLFAARVFDYAYTYTLKSKTETIYDSNGNATSSTTEYTYNGNPYYTPQLASKKITRSDGAEILEKYMYSEDLMMNDIPGVTDGNANIARDPGSAYPKCPDFITTMYQRHMLNYPILNTTTIKRGAGQKITEATLLDYYGDSTLKPNAAYQLSNFGLSDITLDNISWASTAPASACSYNIANKFEKVADFEFDAKFNLAKIQKVNQAPVFYLWGKSDLLPLAKIVAGNNTMTIPSTLRNSFLDGTASLRSDIVSALTGDCFIYTYTHRRTEGITSQSDPNGRTIYYDYDALGRLNIIKDNDLNILKIFEYNYANTPTKTTP